MQKKKLIAAAVAIALQTYYYPAMAADNDNSDDKKTCPANISLLSKTAREKLPATCLVGQDTNHDWAWIAGSVAALITGIAIGNHDSGGSDHHSSPPVPPDDDGGDVTPPDDGGGDNTPTDNTVKTFSNGITIDKGKDTLAFDDIKLDNEKHLGPATFNYSTQNDQWQMTTQDGKTLYITDWHVDGNNAAIIEGTQANGDYWKYDSRGYLILADDQTAVITGDNETHAFDRGQDVSGQGKTGAIISGDNTTNTLNGGSHVSDGAVGIVISGEDTTNVISGQSSVDNAIGALISGSGSSLDVSGGIDVTGGGTGLIVDGDNISINNAGTSNTRGKGSTGVIIKGNNANIVNSGDMTITDGATGGAITGDSAIITNKGDSTTSGSGSAAMILDGDGATMTNKGSQTVSDGGTSIVINGNKANVTNDGAQTISGGGTGTKITGDNAIVNNTGETIVSDAGSVAMTIDGNNALVLNEGDQTISGGGTGARIRGEGATLSSTGDIHVDGTGSAAVILSGNDARTTQTGDLVVTHGASGLVSYGKNNSATNTGHTTVQDKDSIAFIVAGPGNTLTNKGDIDASLNGTGALLSGDGSQLMQKGTINVTAAQDSSGLYRGATGVNVSGNNTTTDIQGDITLTSSFDDTSTLADETLTGVLITGNNNTVSLTGSLDVDMVDHSPTDSERLDSVGIDIQGDGNTVNLSGGINLTLNTNGDSDVTSLTGIRINGDSTATLSGHSQLDITDIVGTTLTLAEVEGGGELVLDKNSVVDITYTQVPSIYYNEKGLLSASGQGSVMDNQGDINIQSTSLLLEAQNGAAVKNSGNINETFGTGDGRGAGMSAQENGSTATNEAGGHITITSSATPVYAGGYEIYPQSWYTNTAYGMMAYFYGSITNEAGGEISVYGAGLYGMGSNQGTATNAGNIYVDGFQQTLDADGNIVGEGTYWSTTHLELPSAGMIVGTDAAGYMVGDATAINTGTITVNNAGYGMTAMSGGTAINQGTINLTADADVTGGANQLVGMVAVMGGQAINDKTGIINIDAAYGQPFYAESGGMIINYGTICIQGTCQDSTTYNPTDNYVSLVYADDMIAAAGETVTLTKNALIEGDVTNDGTVNSQQLALQDSDSTLTNNATGVINSNITVNDGTMNNNTSGVINGKITLNDGTVNNEGTVNGVALNGGTFNNEGTVNTHITTNGGTFNNLSGGQVLRGAQLNGNTVVNNSGTWSFGNSSDGNYASSMDIKSNSVFNNNNGGVLIIDNAKNNINLYDNGRLYNTGQIEITNATDSAGITVQNGTGAFINAGVVDATAQSVMKGAPNASSNHAFFWNQDAGIVNYDVDNGKAINFTGSNYVAENDGTMNISGNNATAMYGSKNAQLVNNGTINLGTTGTTDTGMVAMALDANATADAVIENNGTINIHASNSYAFSVAGAGHVVNNGTVVIDPTVTGSGLIKQGDTVNVEGTNGNNGNSSEVHYTDYTLPGTPSTVSGSSSSTPASSSDMNNLSGYVVGTNADGSAGQLKVSNASMDGVGINTGFTAGTADTTVTFDNVVEGSNLTDASAIQSTSVVWNAQGSTDTDGNVDVTMTKNAYTAVATDTSVNSVAKALDAGYTNNELYTSLNVDTTAELNNALKQVSGSQATTAFREARILSNRFNMLADAAPQVKEGLSFNAVAKGDPRAELGNDTQYDMLALRQTLDLTENQNLTLEYGIARIDGNGSQSAGDNGLTGGYSQFFGLKHSMAFDSGLAWNNALRYDVHSLDSSRAVSYGDVSKVADSSARQQYMEFRSEGAKTFSLLDDALKVTPYAGVKFRHTLEDGYQEHSAGDFNLSMNASSETAVDSVFGLKLDYAGKNGWGASATLEGGPNLSYAKSQRTASLQGAAGQQFSVDDGQKGGGINGLATVGVKYSAKDTRLSVDAYQWKEDNISDKGFMLNLKKTF
ncbi:autotransporter adhesin BigA [Enterobacter mori]|uniref:Autotransporter adhesin BigA n=1 Tax=Enterobacter mori TaxID=539813 RepID=A0A7T0DXC3_9ENTR|nr:autotransporter adhesin BigA [Enterobacter mori]QPK01172.1 autotransporter adhesin BigA [Enterobacter mori]